MTKPEPNYSHPDWCDRSVCTAFSGDGEGRHWSAPWRVDPPAFGHPVIEVRLWLADSEPITERPAVELRVTRTDCTTSIESYDTCPSQIRDLAAVLVKVADVAEPTGDTP